MYRPDELLHILSGGRHRWRVLVTPDHATLRFGDLIEFQLYRHGYDPPTETETKDAVADLTRRMDDMTKVFHNVITTLVLDRHTRDHPKSKAPADVLLLKMTGASLNGLPVQYRFDALVAAVHSHNAEACEALMPVSDDVLGHVDPDGRSLAGMLCRMMNAAPWRRCDCRNNPDQFKALLMVTRWVRAGGGVVGSVAFAKHTSFACPDAAAHEAVQARRLEVGAAWPS
jgi:hypothetical protein